MSESKNDEASQSPENTEDYLEYIYRGIDRAHEGERAGQWWSTNPYYVLNRVGKNGTMFVATVSRSELEKHAKDVSLEAEYKNYFFSDKDPSTTRQATPKEMEELQSKATYVKAKVGRMLMKPPENPIKVGREIFSSKKGT